MQYMTGISVRLDLRTIIFWLHANAVLFFYLLGSPENAAVFFIDDCLQILWIEVNTFINSLPSINYSAIS